MANYWMALVLWLIFGRYGAHHFYLGRYGYAVYCLVTNNIFGIGWLVDIGYLNQYVNESNEISELRQDQERTEYQDDSNNEESYEGLQEPLEREIHEQESHEHTSHDNNNHGQQTNQTHSGNGRNVHELHESSQNSHSVYNNVERGNSHNNFPQSTTVNSVISSWQILNMLIMGLCLGIIGSSIGSSIGHVYLIEGELLIHDAGFMQLLLANLFAGLGVYILGNDSRRQVNLITCVAPPLITSLILSSFFGYFTLFFGALASTVSAVCYTKCNRLSNERNQRFAKLSYVMVVFLSLILLMVIDNSASGLAGGYYDPDGYLSTTFIIKSFYIDTRGRMRIEYWFRGQNGAPMF